MLRSWICEWIYVRHYRSFNPRPAKLSSLSFLYQVHTWRCRRNNLRENDKKLISIFAQRWRSWARFLPRWQVFAKLQPSPTWVTTTRNGVQYITRPIVCRWASIESSFFYHFHIFTRDVSQCWCHFPTLSLFGIVRFTKGRITAPQSNLRLEFICAAQHRYSNRWPWHAPAEIVELNISASSNRCQEFFEEWTSVSLAWRIPWTVGLVLYPVASLNGKKSSCCVLSVWGQEILFFVFSIFMPQVVCNWKICLRALYCPKMSL